MEFYTPPEVSTLLAKLLGPKPVDKIFDPACGSSSLLIKVGKEVGSEDFFLAGQESNGSTWAIYKMNLFLHGMDIARIEWCDTLTNPRLVQGDELMKFNIVVANPPFSLGKWSAEIAEIDRFRRFHRGISLKSRGNYAFICHMIKIALHGEGRVGIIAPHEVLFRGGREGTIRQKLIEEKVIVSAGINVIKKWDATTDSELMILRGHDSWIRSVVFAHDGKHIVSGGDDNTIRFCDISIGENIVTLRGHESSVRSAVITLDGKQIVSDSQDNTVKVWNMSTDHEVGRFVGHIDRVYSVAVICKMKAHHL